MIISNYSDRQTPQFRVLTDEQCNELFRTSLEVLQRVGVLVYSAEGRALLADAGAFVEGERVFIPPHIVQDALTCAPRSFSLWGRDYRHEMHIVPDKIHFGPGLTSTYFIDPETGERRPARRGDPATTARVCDALTHIDYVMGLGMIGDVEPGLAALYEFAELVENTTKPIIAWAQRPDILAALHRIAVAIAGSGSAFRLRPTFGVFTTYDPPLKHTDAGVGTMLWAAANYVPVVYSGGPSMGLTSPVTGASAMVIYLAGALSGLAMAQLKRRGAPYISGWVPAPMDLRTTQLAYGAPEMSQFSAAAADMCRWLRVPFMGTAGASDAKTLDQQAALEMGIQILLSALSGASLVHDLGFLDSGHIGSLQMVVLADEVISKVRHMMRGPEINHETIMQDVIEQAGPGGQFMAEMRSVALCRQEIWVPTLMERGPYSLWEAAGGKSLADRTQEKLSRILSTHQPSALPEDVVAQIDRIVAEMEEQGVGSNNRNT